MGSLSSSAGSQFNLLWWVSPWETVMFVSFGGR